jgi:chemotaxis protein methyltransferase CheR
VERSSSAERNSEIELRLLIEAIYLKYSYDFRDYSGASIKRRVQHALSQFESEMFRDPSHFLAIRNEVVPLLRTYPSLKIWIAGCSTGEEVYSMAILLREEGLLDRTIIYATDINPRSLEKAKQGIFSMENVRAYTANYQQAGGQRSFADYYTAAYGYAIFDKSLCENVTFADHSLATDSVFSETQLISCRNVLIYFNKKLQDRAFGLFHESLSHRGFLVLGSKETLDFSNYSNQFEALVKQERIYRKS